MRDQHSIVLNTRPGEFLNGLFEEAAVCMCVRVRVHVCAFAWTCAHANAVLTTVSACLYSTQMSVLLKLIHVL